MKTMVGMKTCGSLRSMRHIPTRPYEDKSVPHLTLYVQQMNKTKLLKEKEVLMVRLGEVNKQINDIDSLIMKLRPKLGLPEPKHGRSKRNDGEGTRKDKIRTKRMKMAF